jgi:hypothetical protein
MVLCIYCLDLGIKTKYTEQSGAAMRLCAYLYIYIAAAALLLVAAACKKRADLGNANVCASVQKRNARALIVSSICARVRCCCVQKLKTTSFVSKIKAASHDAHQIKVFLSLSPVDDCASKKKPARKLPPASDSATC